MVAQQRNKKLEAIHKNVRQTRKQLEANYSK